jgi:hypothetical protein
MQDICHDPIHALAGNITQLGVFTCHNVHFASPALLKIASLVQSALRGKET